MKNSKLVFSFIKPYLHVLLIAVLAGSLSFIFTIFISINGVETLVNYLETSTFVKSTLYIILIFALLKGILHYIEQYMNHYLAFKVLARIRHVIFKKLRSLGLAKLDKSNKTEILSVITNDIEFLEIFYAHTLSPVLIYLVTTIFLSIYLFNINPLFFMILIISHFTIGVLIPLITNKKSNNIGNSLRQKNNKLNEYFYDKLTGVDVVLEYDLKDTVINKIKLLSSDYEKTNKKSKNFSYVIINITSLLIFFFSLVMFYFSYYLYMKGSVTFLQASVSFIIIISSFSRVVSLANLSFGLANTRASFKRIFELLNETPETKSVHSNKVVNYESLNLNNISFSYEDKNIVENFNLESNENEIVALVGKSGIGKSTILKLIMRYYDVNSGEISINNEGIITIDSHNLKKNITLVEQNTYLFKDTILNNLLISNQNATIEEVKIACKKAGIYDFIMSLENNFDTLVEESAKNLSSGQIQRIGLARAFLRKSNLILLDEITSNLDSINQALILNSIKEENNKTYILVTHNEEVSKHANRVIRLGEV